jgi:hypothetical protein
MELPGAWQSRLHTEWRSADAAWRVDGYLRYQAHAEHPTSVGLTLDRKF